jgi:hypothetical protein
MKTTIYCFSATGNSLKLARDVQSALGDCDVVSIAQALQRQDLPCPGERIGLVFPVFAWGLPRMVVDFVQRLDLRHAKYVFAITTCVAIPGNTLRELQSHLEAKGSFLHAGFAISASRSSLMKLNRLDKIMIRIDGQRKDMRRGEERLSEIGVRRRLSYDFRAGRPSKLATVAQFAALTAILFRSEVLPWMAALAGIVGLAAAGDYIRRALRAAASRVDQQR